MEDSITLSVITPAGSAFYGKAYYISLPELGGQIGILPGHAPLLAALEEGEVLCRQQNGIVQVHVSCGVAEISDNHVSVLVAAAEIIK